MKFGWVKLLLPTFRNTVVCAIIAQVVLDIALAINEGFCSIIIRAFYTLLGHKLSANKVSNCDFRVNVCFVIYAINAKAK